MRSWVVLVSLVALPSLAAGQSLGDAAKKERDRRDKLRQAGAGTRTITGDDLAANKGALANDPKQPPAGGNGEAGKQAERATASGPDATASQSGEAYWRRRVAAARAAVAAAERRNDAFQRMIRFGQPGELDENGKRVIYSIHQMKALADAAAAELASAQAALEAVLEEGRRSGAQPGWLR